MGRSIDKIRSQGFPTMPVVPTESKGIMSGPIRKSRRQGRRMRPRGSRPDEQKIIGMSPRGPVYQSAPRQQRDSIGRRMPPRDMRLIPKETFRDDPRVRPLTG